MPGRVRKRQCGMKNGEFMEPRPGLGLGLGLYSSDFHPPIDSGKVTVRVLD